MEKSLLKGFIFYLCITHIISTFGFDLAKPYNISTYQCLKQQNFKFAIIRAYRSLGIVDTNAVQSLKTARSIGMDTDVYFFPCRSKNPDTMVQQMMEAVPSNLYGMVWIDIQTNPSPNCGWTDDAQGNCVFTQQLVSAIKKRGKKAGIYASPYMWRQIYKNQTACKQLASEPLWYARYDGIPNMTDFVEFGGWKNASIKQYTGGSTVCGADIDHDFMP